LNIIFLLFRPKKSSNPYSTLIISDHHAVHGLFDFLLNWIDPIASRRAEGFPLLISPKPFLNASLKAAQVNVLKLKKKALSFSLSLSFFS